MQHEVSRGAWVRTEDNTYGKGKYPFGKCHDCDKPACHRIASDGSYRLVCMSHKGEAFSPFLGQQTKIFAATSRWVLAGGGAGGSKTYGGARLWLKQYFAEESRYQAARSDGKEFASKGWAIFFRRTMPELLQVIEDFKRYYLKVDPLARWNEQQKMCVFSNGYKVQFGGMENDDGYLRYYGGEYTLVVMDEATQFTVKQIQEIDARIRCSDRVLDKRCQFYMLTNPVGGVTKQYLRDEYVKTGPPEKPMPVTVTLADGRQLTEYKVYIPSNLYDNPALVASGRYEASLKKRGATMRNALLYNDWDSEEGTWVGDDWDPSVHVIKPHAIPKSWTRFKMADWGFSDRTAVHWAAVDQDGAMVVYRSWSCRKKTAVQVAQAIKDIESRPLTWKDPSTGQTITVTGPEWDMESDCSSVYGPMDAQCWAKTGYEVSIGEVFDNAGCGFYKSQKGTNVRHTSADQIRTRLQTRYADHNGRLEPGKAGLRFFAGTTETRISTADGRVTITGPIHTIPVLPADIADPDVWDSGADDHDMDALAYGCTSRQMSAEEIEENTLLDFMSLRTNKTSNGKIEW